MPKEIWKDIPGWEGYYRVSNMGRVKTVSRVVTKNNGKTQTVKERIMTATPSKYGGYLYVSLYRNNKPERRYIHDLVLTTFVGPRPSGKECCHFPDTNPRNNRVENLRWGTPLENTQDSIRLGRHPHGSKHKNSKLTEREVRWIRKRRRMGETLESIAKDYKVRMTNIHHIIANKTWRHVT